MGIVTRKLNNALTIIAIEIPGRKGKILVHK